MRRRVGAEPAQRLRKLAFGADPTPAPGLVPRDRDVHESLEEVAFLLWRVAPCVLELFVRREELAGPDQRDAAFKRGLELLRLPPGRRRSGAGSPGRTRSDRSGRRTASRATGR